jgi:hypothetical protein
VRLTILVLAILALPALALADTIDYSGAGSLSAGTAVVSGKVAPGHTWGVLDNLIEIDNETTGVIQQGILGKVDIVTGTLSSCAQGLCFTGGDLDIRNSSGSVIFKGEFTSGTIAKISGNIFLNAVMANGATVLLEDTKGNFSSDSTITTGHHVIPEPSTLGLLGLGLVSLAYFRYALDKTAGQVLTK